jgi:hypothetical protein
MSVISHLKFHFKVILRSLLAIVPMIVCVYLAVTYIQSSNSENVHSQEVNNLISLAKEVSKTKDGQELYQKTLSDEGSLISSLDSNVPSYSEALKAYLEDVPKKKRVIDYSALNLELKKVALYYENVFSILEENRYIQRHRVKEMFYSLEDNIPFTRDVFLKQIEEELVKAGSFREYLLDSRISESSKARSDKSVGNAIASLKSMKSKINFAGEDYSEKHWNNNLVNIQSYLINLMPSALHSGYEKEFSGFSLSMIVVTFLYALSVIILMTWTNDKEYGLLAQKNDELSKLKSKREINKAKEKILDTLKETDDLPLALLNAREDIIWSNEGFDSLFLFSESCNKSWNIISKERVYPTSQNTGINNSVKVKGRGEKDFLLKSHSFVSSDKNFRLLKLIDVSSSYISLKDLVPGVNSQNLVDPYDLIEEVLENLSNWSSFFNFNVAETKSLTAFYKMDPVLLRQEFGNLVASLIYFAKAKEYSPGITFDVITNSKGFLFKIQLSGIHLNSEEIGSSISLRGKRYVPLMDSFSNIENALKSLDGRVIIKNLTRSNGSKDVEIQLSLKEETLVGSIPLRKVELVSAT